MFSRTVNEKYSPYTDSRQTHTQVTESSGHAEPPTGSFNKTLTGCVNN